MSETSPPPGSNDNGGDPKPDASPKIRAGDYVYDTYGRAQADIQILGQSIAYPKTTQGLIALIVLAVAIAFILWRILDSPITRHISTGFVSLMLKDSGPVSESVVRLGFWTPSNNTKNSWIEHINAKQEPKLDPDAAMALVPAENKWELTMGTEEKLKEFADRIRSTSMMKGYRRYQTAGEGRTLFKEGWWWVVTMDGRYKPDEFRKLYTEFFGMKREVYLEVFISSSTIP
jgi:hypothetical protein